MLHQTGRAVPAAPPPPHRCTAPHTCSAQTLAVASLSPPCNPRWAFGVLLKGHLVAVTHLFSLFNTAFAFQTSRVSPLLTFSCNSPLRKTGHMFYCFPVLVLSLCVLEGELHEDGSFCVLFCFVALFFIA